MKSRLQLLTFLLLVNFQVNAQLIIEPLSDSLTAKEIIYNSFLGKGIQIKKVRFIGDIQSMGLFNDSLKKTGFKSGFILSTGLAEQAAGPNGRSNSGANLSTHFFKDNDLNPTAKQCDGIDILIDFIPQYDSIGLNYSFGSEEYPEFVGKEYNDEFGFFIRPMQSSESPFVNMATIDDSINVGINSINGQSNQVLFNDNSDHRSPLFSYIEFDGLTVPLHSGYKVIPGNLYQLKIIIADIGDCEYDSGLFIEQGSFCSIKRGKQKKITQRPKRQLTKLDSNAIVVHFQQNKHNLSLNELHYVLHVSDSIRNISFDSIVIEGYTDPIFKENNELLLSTKRAIEVKELLTTYGVQCNQYRITGNKSARPLSENTDKNGRALNRRVEIKFYPKN